MSTDLQERIDAAARPAAEHADRVVDGWSQEAYEHVIAYAKWHRTFIAEDVRLFAEETGFPVPPSRRAWGAVMIRAKRDGKISSIGYAMSTSPTANPTPVTKWMSLVYEGGEA